MDVGESTIENMLRITYGILRVEPLDKLLEQIAYIVSKEFKIRYVIVGLYNEETKLFEEKVLYGYSKETVEKLGKRSYTMERSKEDLSDDRLIGPRCFYVRPVDIGLIRKEEFGYARNPAMALEPRKSPDEWQSLDYIDFMMTDKEGNWIGWLEILEPNDYKIPNKETLNRIQIFTDLASIAIENAKMFENVDKARLESEGHLDLILHDIANRLTPLTIYLRELATGMELKEPAAKMLDNAMKVASSIEKLVIGVRTMSRIKDELEPKLKPVALKEIIDECLDEMNRNYPDIFINITREFPYNKVNALGDDLTWLMFYNIIENAVKFSKKPDVTVGIRIMDELKYWRIEIEDHGKGIPDSLKKTIFSRFDGKAGGSTGLGMSLIRMLANRYCGTVYVRDRVVGDYSQGACIVVDLPKAE